MAGLQSHGWAVVEVERPRPPVSGEERGVPRGERGSSTPWAGPCSVREDSVEEAGCRCTDEPGTLTGVFFSLPHSRACCLSLGDSGELGPLPSPHPLCYICLLIPTRLSHRTVLSSTRRWHNHSLVSFQPRNGIREAGPTKPSLVTSRRFSTTDGIPPNTTLRCSPGGQRGPQPLL